MIYNLNIIKTFGFILIAIWLLPSNLKSQNIQDLYNQYDVKYGMDAQIYKGAKYMSEHHPEFGFPFLFQSSAFIGSIYTNNFTLDSVELKYDIYKQFLIFGYINNIGAKQQIVLNSDEIKKFYLGNNCFVRNTDENISASFLHQISDDSISCYISYRKDYKFVSNNSKKGFGYTSEIRNLFIAVNGSLILLNNKKNLLNNLPESITPKVKEYLSQRQFNFKKANALELTQLFSYINSLLQ